MLLFTAAMLFRSTDVPADYLGVRGEGERRKGERRRQSRAGSDRRASERRKAALRGTLLAAVAVALPHQVKPEALSPAWLRPPVPSVTTTQPDASPRGATRCRRESAPIEQAVAVPAVHAYDDFIQEASTRYRVDATLIRSVMQIESAFDALAVSRTGAMGLMQLMPDVAVELGVEDPFDPRQNVMGGVKYLRQLLDQYRGNVRLALASYNAGATNVAQYGGVPPFPETQKYVKRITRLVDSSRRPQPK